ncbi:diguanylate cyclase domain-containing protein [Pelotomaculum propionicicum]|uniref:diguanylate cyclase domain-containing protein n=1 Tax=Pelotomaculum propionicicum TaxID=258475 RepID=UPI003B7AEE3E
MNQIHNLLRRQLKQHFGDNFLVPGEWQSFINAVNDAYRESDADRSMLERALDLSSQELLQANSEMRAVIMFFPDVFLWIDYEGTVLDYKAGSTTNLSLIGSMVGKKIQDISLEFVGEKFYEAIQQIKENGTATSIEYQFLMEGIKKFFEARLLPLLSNKIFVVIRDITERKLAEEKLQESEKHLRTILDSIHSGVVLIDEESHVIKDVNRMAIEIIGLPKEKIIGSRCHRYICPAEENKCPITDLGQKVDHAERTMIRFDGKPLPIIKTVRKLTLSNRSYLLESFIDITERKNMEEQLRHLSLHDALTGLYNRVYFEEEMRRLESGRYNPVGIVLCDVDGLKLVNDTLGHESGDILLIETANVIKKAMRQGDMVARIGGDEFAILLPNSDVADVESICARIRDSINTFNANSAGFTLSLSLGYSVADASPNDMGSLFKEADDNMYREKMLHRQSASSTIVKTLMKALEARDFITEGHADRLQRLVESMAGRIGINNKGVADLCLLAKFHDIGKVGIPDRVLFKPGPLTPEETRVMKQHCEIGYHIAQSASVLMDIGEWIHKHHEWWNGKGYPLGLKGEEIPLECRILSIADAYDAMTSDRPYRAAMPHERAVAEIKRCAGTQFDPNLVPSFLEILERENI